METTLNKVKSHQTFDQQKQQETLILQNPQLMNTTNSKAQLLSPFHGTDEIQYLMYKKSSQSHKRKNRRDHPHDGNDNNKTIQQNESLLQQQQHFKEYNVLDSSSQRQGSKQQKGGKNKNKILKGVIGKKNNGKGENDHGQFSDEDHKIVKELINEERTQGLSGNDYIEEEGWALVENQGSINLPKIDLQSSQFPIQKRPAKQMQSNNHSMVSLSSPNAIPQTINSLIFNKQRASQQVGNKEEFLQIKKINESQERIKPPPVSLKMRLPSNEAVEDDDYYEEEITETAGRNGKRKKKDDILTGWNNNRHPIFLNESKSDVQMDQLQKKKKSIIKTQRNIQEERKMIEHRREQANLNAVSVTNIEIPAFAQFKDAKTSNAHQLINQIKKHNVSKKFTLVGSVEQKLDSSEDHGAHSQVSKRYDEPMIVMQKQGQGGSNSDVCEKYLHRMVSPARIDPSSASERFEKAVVGSQFGNNNSMLFSDLDAKRESIMNQTIMNNYNQNNTNPMAMSSKHFTQLPFINTKKDHRRDYVPHNVEISQLSYQQSAVDIDSVKKQVIQQVNIMYEKANAKKNNQKFLKVSEFPVQFQLPENQTTSMGQLKGTNINLNEKVINRQLNKRYSRNVIHELKSLTNSSKESKDAGGVSYCIYPMHNANQTQRRIVFQTNQSTDHIVEEQEDTPSFMFNSYQQQSHNPQQTS